MTQGSQPETSLVPVVQMPWAQLPVVPPVVVVPPVAVVPPVFLEPPVAGAPPVLVAPPVPPPPQDTLPEAELRGLAVTLLKSAELLSVSVQPLPARLSELELSGVGAGPVPS